MDGRSRWLPVLLTSVALFLLPSMAAAGPKDAAATRMADDAISNDYLALKFNEAAKKLRAALATCGGAGCSAQVRARLHRDLGVVLIAGLNRAGEGKKEFAEAVKADPRITLEKDLTTPAIEKAFQAARGNAGASAPATTAPGPAAAAEGDIVHTPVSEQAVLTPVPVYVELPAGVAAAKVLLMYKPFGATDWQKLELRKLGTGYGGEIPCQAVGSATGDLSYYVQANDAEGDILATSGTRKAPNKVPIQNEIAGEPPHLPGRPAPAKCKDKADCPPGFPGCSSKKSGTKGWGVGCEKDSECGEGLACKAGACETGQKRDSGDSSSGRVCETNQDCDAGEKCNADKVCEGPGSRAKKLWLSFNVQQDVSIVPSLKDACGNFDNEPPPYVTCIAEDGGDYLGIPLPADAELGTGNEIKGGPRFSTTRLLLDLSYLVTKNISIGARLGYVLNTQPKRNNAKVHAEGRLAYWFGADPFAKQSLRPYIAVMGGAAEVDDKYTVQVFETICTNDAECARPENQAKGLVPNPRLTAWRRASTIFAGGAIGLMIPTSANQGILAEVKAQVFFPNKGYTVSPTIGYALGF